MEIAECLRQMQAQGLGRLDAQRLLLHALEREPNDRAWLLAHDSDPVSESSLEHLRCLTSRHGHGEPMAYLTGRQEFFGLDLRVDARVLVPRPDTETLVEWALEVLPDRAKVLDLGTGSGAIALALKHVRPDAQIAAVDLSHDALLVARANAQRLKIDVTFRQGCWLEGVQDTLDAIVSNPPYVAQQDPHLAELTHEPASALTSGEDGLCDIRTIIVQSRTRLKHSGWLLLEHGYDQAERVRSLLIESGFVEVQSRLDLAGVERCSGGKMP